jgi:hypothetical protein
MKSSAILSFIILFFIASYSTMNGNAPASMSEKKDTCFYYLKIPRDIDMPETPYFDTTIVRSSDCTVHILVLQSWGTQTSYILSSTKEERTASFNSGKNGTMDITNLPEGKYGMSLMACGNGGGFTLRIK